MGQIIERRNDGFQPRGGDGKFKQTGTVGIEQRGSEGVVERTVETSDKPKTILSQHESKPLHVDESQHAPPKKPWHNETDVIST